MCKTDLYIRNANKFLNKVNSNDKIENYINLSTELEVYILCLFYMNNMNKLKSSSLFSKFLNEENILIFLIVFVYNNSKEYIEDELIDIFYQYDLRCLYFINRKDNMKIFKICNLNNKAILYIRDVNYILCNTIKLDTEINYFEELATNNNLIIPNKILINNFENFLYFLEDDKFRKIITSNFNDTFDCIAKNDDLSLITEDLISLKYFINNEL